jgi:membrane protein implicated in regulation of membrane protease activity
MTAAWLSNWYNLIFIVPFGLALVYLALYTLSGWTFGDADVDAHADVDTDLDAHADIGTDHDAHAGHDHDADHDANGSAALAVLSWFGVGRAPLSILMMMLLMCWGIIGFAVNSSVRTRWPAIQPWLISIPAAGIGALLLTKLLAGFLGRFLPTSETYARRRHALLGSVGEVVLPVDRGFGMVAVRDRSGELFQLPCRLEAGDRTIAKGTKVTLVAYSATEKLFYVLESEFGDADRPNSSARTTA